MSIEVSWLIGCSNRWCMTYAERYAIRDVCMVHGYI